MEGLLKRALVKFHYMREHPLISRSTSYFITIGKIHGIGQSAGNQSYSLGSSETTREKVTLNEKKFFK